MNNEIKFPYHGAYVAKRSGYEWNYWINEDGAVTCVERYYYDHYNGKDHHKYVIGTVTNELLRDVEKKLGMKTDGWKWTV